MTTEQRVPRTGDEFDYREEFRAQVIMRRDESGKFVYRGQVRHLLNVCVGYANPETGKFYMSQQRAADALGVTVQGNGRGPVSRMMKRLRADEVLAVVKRGARGRATVYQLVVTTRPTSDDCRSGTGSAEQGHGEVVSETTTRPPRTGSRRTNARPTRSDYPSSSTSNTRPTGCDYPSTPDGAVKYHGVKRSGTSQRESLRDSAGSAGAAPAPRSAPAGDAAWEECVVCGDDTPEFCAAHIDAAEMFAEMIKGQKNDGNKARGTTAEVADIFRAQDPDERKTNFEDRAARLARCHDCDVPFIRRGEKIGGLYFGSFCPAHE